jgi:uncharacterized membrane protein YfcA
MICPPALPGAFGYLYPPGLLIIAAASRLPAPLDTRAAHELPVRQQQRTFAVLLYALAAYMLTRAFA